jgi:hypothetical protein
MNKDFSEKQMNILLQKKCPDCDAKLMPGPRGGAAQNFYCTNRPECGQGYNLTFGMGPILIFAQRIGKVDHQTYLMYERAHHA